MSMPSSSDVPSVSAAQAAPSVAPLAGPLNPNTWAERGLYGGAITAAIPKRFTDCSDFRQIPNHQEVWADADTDQSLIVELNSFDEDVPDSEAAAHYMRDLAVANEAHSAEITSSGTLTAAELPGFGASVCASYVVCRQLISKFKESADKANSVQIYLAVIRLRAVTTDLLISFNVPTQFGEGSSSAGRAIMDSSENRAVIEGVLASIKVQDWSLFGSG